MLRVSGSRLVFALALTSVVAAYAISGCADSQESDATASIATACPDALAAGAALGITPIPDDVPAAYGQIFCKYTEIIAPNGKPIRIFAEKEISNEQLVHARGVLAFFIEDVPGSEYGADKSAIANRMADNEATLVMMKGHDGEFDRYDSDAWEEIDGQALYEDETVATGSDWYVNNVYEGHRDASFEEILHLVHDNGIGIDVEWMPEGAAPEYQAHIREAMDNALYDEGLWAQGERTADWIEELREEGSLTQEYLASVIDAYYGLWGAFTERPGGMWGIYVAKTREEIAEKDPRGYALMEMFFNPYVTYEARVDGGFEGTFMMSFDPETPYTHKSQYLVNVTLTGENDSGLSGNDQDNRLRGNTGDNALDGRDGIDTARFTGPRDEYQISREGNTVTVEDSVAGRDGIDTLTGIEQLEFSDSSVGTVEVGKIADLIVVGANPLDHISNLRGLEMVFKGGVPMSPVQGEGQASFWELYMR